MNNQLEMTRFNLRLPKQMKEQIEEYSNSLGINQNAGYLLLLKKALEQQNTMVIMSELLEELKKNTSKENDKILLNYIKEKSSSNI